MSKPMVENTKVYKEMILHMMDTLNALSYAENEFKDPIENSKIFQHMVLNSTSCLDKIEYKVYPVYPILQRYISSIVMTDTYISDYNDKTIHFYTDMRYFHNNNIYDRMSYGINITIYKDNTIISPYLDLVYMNLKSRLVLTSHKMHTKNSNKYTFYKLYDTILTSIEKLMLEEYKDIYDNMKIMNIYSKNIIEEMTILVVLLYMRYIVPKDDHTRFMEIEDDLKDNIDTTKAIYEINKSLLDIGTKYPKLLGDIISKIRDIISKVK